MPGHQATRTPPTDDGLDAILDAWSAAVLGLAATSAAQVPTLIVDDGTGEIRVDGVTVDVGPATAEPPPPATAPVLPVLGADGILHAPAGRLTLTPLKARLLRPLLRRPLHCVSRRELERAGWPDRHVGSRALDGRMASLRRDVQPFGVVIHGIRGHGYLLEPAPADAVPRSPARTVP